VTEDKRPLAGAALGKFTPDIQDRLIKLVRMGYTRAEAARQCKIAPRTFGYWMAKGQANLVSLAEAEERQRGSGELDEFGLFRLEVEAAAQQFLGSMMNVVLKKAASDAPDAWQAAKWILERRSPEWRRQPARSEADDPEDVERPSGAGGETVVPGGFTSEAAASIEEKFFGITRSSTP
jgi:hypothetical protein